MSRNLLCLEGLIGIRTPCETLPSSSGYMLNHIEGISLRFADSITDPEYGSGLQMLKDTLEYATLLVADEMKKMFSPLVQINSQLESMQLCTLFDTQMTVAGQAMSGARMRLLQNPPSLSIKYDIPYIDILPNADAIVDIKVTDGTTTTNFANVELIGGTKNRLLLDYRAVTSTVFIWFDQTGLLMANGGCTAGCAGCGTATPVSRYLAIDGWNGSGSFSHTFGIVPYVVVSCDKDQMACGYKENIALPILYKSGSLLYRKLATSKRGNLFTIYSNHDDAIAMADRLEAEYKSQMQAELKSLFYNIKQNKDVCISCKSNSYGWVIP